MSVRLLMPVFARMRFVAVFSSALALACAAFAGAGNGRAVYYVSADGNDGNDGCTAATAWRTIGKLNAALPPGGEARLRCGDVFYGTLEVKGGKSPAAPTSITAFGEGKLPEISVYKIAVPEKRTWEKVGENLWRIDLFDPAATSGNPVRNGNVGFLLVDGKIYGRKLFGDETPSRQWDFKDDLRRVTVWSEKNPSEMSCDIRFAPGVNAVRLAKNLSLNRIAFRGAGAHGAGGVGENVRISGCRFAEIGGSKLVGSLNANLRYGNGIECWANSTRITVERCRFSDIYDVAFTMQGPAPLRSWEDVVVRGCEIVRCTQAFEVWTEKCPRGIGMKNCSFVKNRCIDTGFGWGYDVRPNKNVSAPLLVYEMQTDLCDILVAGNVFVNSRQYLIFNKMGLGSLPAGFKVVDNTVIGRGSESLGNSDGEKFPGRARELAAKIGANNVFIGSDSLWKLVFADKTLLKPSQCDFRAVGDGGELVFSSPAAEVSVTVKPVATGVEFSGRVSSRKGTVMDFLLPARIEFPADGISRVAFPGDKWMGTGYSLKPEFFSQRKKADGLWYELGGTYPGLFADFVHVGRKNASSWSLMGVQNRPDHEPWKCPVPFVMASLRIGGCRGGGWIEHGFKTYVKKGENWNTPAVRIVHGLSLDGLCEEYVRANNLRRELADKVGDPLKLERLKKAPLLYLGDNCAKCRRAIPKIPSPSLIHQAQYLHGGFDKQYPDHLPVNPKYGTDAEMLDFIRELKAAGHLYSPYTNPTWWCDNPKGPTFLAAGDAPLSVNAGGKHIRERYGTNEGWTVSFWHPAVKAANRKTRQSFADYFDVDILFQDQCGIRRLAYDFNSACPRPTAYIEGVLSMVEEDARVIPLGTEDGWDRIAREQTALCGLSWGTVPVQDRPVAINVITKNSLPAHLWEIEAVPARLFHDMCLFYLHDLGGFAHNERVLAWCLALGYQLSYRCNAWHFVWDKKVKAWYGRLHELQGKIVSAYAGRKLVSFRHDRSPLLGRSDIDPASRDDDGVVFAEYEGGAKAVVNLGNVAREVGGRKLAPYGYFISVDGYEAFSLEGQAPRIVKKAY